MEQLSLLEPLQPNAKTAVWNTLDNTQNRSDSKPGAPNRSNRDQRAC